MGKIHFIEANGEEHIVEATKAPAYDDMKDYVGGFIEHVNVLYNGHFPTTMIVHDEGALIGLPVNEEATRIYWAASASRGYDLSKKEDRDALDAEYAARLGVTPDKVLKLGPSGPPMIYGNAIVLEGIRMR